MGTARREVAVFGSCMPPQKDHARSTFMALSLKLEHRTKL
jgi:hypothetical protein